MDRVKRDARKRERVWGIGASKKRLETRQDGRKMYVFFLLSFSFLFLEYFFFFFLEENLGNNALELVISPTKYKNGEIAVFVSFKKKKTSPSVKINYRFR